MAVAASRQSPTPVRAERSLFTRLFDDAAVFPPGNAPLPEALASHRALRAGPYAALVGPLLVPAASVAGLVALLDGRSEPVRVAVVARPGVGAAEVVAAVSTAAGTPVEVVGLEVGAASGWRDLLGLGVPLTVEVPRADDGQARIVAGLAGATGSTPVQAKLRTGPTPAWPWPDETEVAGFIRAAVDHDLGFKLTGGLHHAVRGTYAASGPASAGPAEEQHGLLNVLAAVRWALNGEEAPAMAELLAERDTAALVATVERMSTADAAVTRAFFTAYGCCGVTDPIGELIALDLLEDSPG